MKTDLRMIHYEKFGFCTRCLLHVVPVFFLFSFVDRIYLFCRVFSLSFQLALPDTEINACRRDKMMIVKIPRELLLKIHAVEFQ